MLRIARTVLNKGICPFVRLSVRPSVTLPCCGKSAKHIVEILSSRIGDCLLTKILTISQHLLANMK